MFDFNESKINYVNSIDDSISFIGKNLDFFVAVKADLLKNKISELLPEVKKPQILDIGCGHGLLHSYISNETYTVTGVDVADEVLELARQSNPSVKYTSYDGMILPFASESFDVVITICVMHHVPPPQWNVFLREMRRVVKKGGIALVFEHNPYNPVTRYVVANSPLDVGVTLISSSNLKILMQQAGFRTAKSDYMFFTPFSSPMFRWLDKALRWLPFGAQYYTVAR